MSILLLSLLVRAHCTHIHTHARMQTSLRTFTIKSTIFLTFFSYITLTFLMRLNRPKVINLSVTPLCHTDILSSVTSSLLPSYLYSFILLFLYSLHPSYTPYTSTHHTYILPDDVDNDDDAALELEEAAASGVFPKKEKDELSVALAAVPEAPIRFSEVSKGGVNGSTAVTGQISANGLMIINENGEEERRTVTAIFAGAERCRR